jgi:hypothetical protein
MTERLPGVTWRALGRIVLKAAALFAGLNLLFAWLQPLDTLGRPSLYNRLAPGRARLPYGENPTQAYNLSLNNLPAMLASHELERPKAADEFRVVVLGDSGAWGWLLDHDETLAAQITAAGVAADGRRVVAYNLGYPIMSLTKDLLLLEQALTRDPDLILWPVTLESFAPEKQLEHPLLQNNPGRVRSLIGRFNLRLDPADPRFAAPDLFGRTIIGQRRALADLLRLQVYAFSWAATGVDQVAPAEVTLRQSDFDEDLSWQAYDGPAELATGDLALDVLAAGIRLAGSTPVIVVNEPIFISRGRHSDLRYNAWYPRWAYDQYRALLAEAAAAGDWRYLDLWAAVPADEFTDSPVHLTPNGTGQLASLLAAAINSGPAPLSR